MPDREYDVFVSYAEADRGWVEGVLLDELSAAGVRCRHEAQFQLGRPRLKEFEHAVQQSGHTLLVLSPAYLADSSLEFVDLLAQNCGQEGGTWPVIPLLYRHVELPPRLRMLEKLDFTDKADWAGQFARLFRELKAEPPARSTRPHCPYPGMEPFGLDSDFPFYGREREVQEVIEKLRLYPLLAVIGASGSGKSSMAYAGIVPALQRSIRFGDGRWLISSFRPGQAAASDETLMSRFEGHLGGSVDTVDRAKATVTRLLQAVRKGPEPDARRLLLIVDQFEEVYTAPRGTEKDKLDADEFHQALMRLARVGDSYVLLTMRADFYGDLMESPLWPEVKPQSRRCELSTLGREAMEQAIVRPAQDQGVFLDDRLVQRLLADAGAEPGILPFLQETLITLWEKLYRRYLPVAVYEDVMSDRGVEFRCGLEVAMARRADAAMAKLPDDEHRQVARRILLRLVQFGEGRLHTRRQQTVAQLRSVSPDERLFKTTLEHLAHKDHRLLSLGGDAPSAERPADDEQRAAEHRRAVDLAHDKLITGWPALRDWIRRRRLAEETRRRLEYKADEWQRLGRGFAGILDATELREADEWLTSSDAYELGHSNQLDDLVRVSRRWVWTQRGIVASIPLLCILALCIWVRSAYQIAGKETARANAEEAKARVTGELAESRKREAEAANQLVDTERRGADRERDLRAEEQLALANVEFQAGRKAAALFHTWNSHRTAKDETIRRLAGQRINTLRDTTEQVLPHESPVYNARFSSDDATVATQTQKNLHLWTLRSLELSRTAPADAAESMRVDFSRSRAVFPQGVAHGRDGITARAVAAPGPGRGATIVVQRGARRILSVDRPNEVPPLALAFDADGNRMAAGGGRSPDGRDWWASVFDANTGKELLPRLGHRYPPTSVAFSSDGKWLATGSQDRTARVWNSNDGKLSLELKHPSVVNDVAFSPAGSILATACADGRVRCWVVGEEEPGYTYRNGELLDVMQHEGSVHSVAFNSSGATLLTASSDGTARLWPTWNGPPRARWLDHPQRNGATRFSSNGELLAVSDPTGLYLIGVATGNVIASRRQPSLNAIGFAANDSLLLTSSERDFQRWDVPSLQPVGAPLSHGAKPDPWSNRTDISPDGRRLLTTAADRAYVWDLESAREKSFQHPGQVSKVLWHPASKTFASAASGDIKNSYIWDIASGSKRELPYDITGFSQDGRTMFGRREDMVVVLDASSGARIAGPFKHRDFVHYIALTAGDRRLVTATNKRIHVWDLVDGRLSSSSVREEVSEYRFVVPPVIVGDSLVIQLDDHVEVVSLQNARMQRTLIHEKLSDFAVAADGTSLVTVGQAPNTLRLWDLESLRPITDLLQLGNDMIPEVEVASDGDSALIKFGIRDGCWIWPLPKPVADKNPDQLRTWVEARTGLTWRDDALHRLTSEEWAQKLKELRRLGGPPGSGTP